MHGIAGLSDVVAIERHAPTLPTSTYKMIGQAAAAHADAPALSFFLRAQDHDRPLTWDYATLFAKITATANFFHSLGVGKDDVIAFVLPNLPQTHLTIWGGQAAGIVFAINPMLEPAAIGELLKAGQAKVLVTLAPFPGSDLWPKLQPVIGSVPGLRHLVLVDLAQHLPAASGQPAAGAQRLEVDAGRIAVPCQRGAGHRAAAVLARRTRDPGHAPGVGKIFKPALKLRETGDALSEALRSAGVAFETVKARNDAAQGTVVDVVLAKGELPQRAHQVLGQFTFRTRLAQS